MSSFDLGESLPTGNASICELGHGFACVKAWVTPGCKVFVWIMLVWERMLISDAVYVCSQWFFLRPLFLCPPAMCHWPCIYRSVMCMEMSRDSH